MFDDLHAKLDAIFEARAKRIAEAQRVRVERDKKQEANLQAFLELQESVIRPTLEALANYLTDRGEESGIYESTDGQQKGNEKLSAAIGIKFYRHVILKSLTKEKVPSLNFLLDKDAGQVLIQYDTSTTQREGVSGESTVDLGAVTADLISAEALKVIQIIFK